MSGCAIRVGQLIYWLGCGGGAVMAVLALASLLFGGGEPHLWTAAFLALGAVAAWFTGRLVRRFFSERTRE